MLSGEAEQPPGAVGLRLVQLRQIIHRNSREAIPYQPFSLDQPRYGFDHRIRLHVQKLCRRGLQLVLGQEAVSRRQVIAQFKQNPRFHPPGVIRRHAKLDGKPIHRPEGGIQSVIHQKIGIVVEQLHRLLPIHLIGSHGQFRRKMVQGEKLHELPHSHPQAEFLADGFGLFPGNPRHLRQAQRLPLHDGQCLIPELLHNPGSHFGSDSLDDPAGKIAENFRAGARHEPFQKFRLKLTAVAGVAAPFARDHQPLAHRRQRDGSHHGDGLSAPHTQPEHSIAVIIILIYHSADHALNNFQFLFVQFLSAPLSRRYPVCISFYCTISDGK